MIFWGLIAEYTLQTAINNYTKSDGHILNMTQSWKACALLVALPTDDSMCM